MTGITWLRIDSTAARTGEGIDLPPKLSRCNEDITNKLVKMTKDRTRKFIKFSTVSKTVAPSAVYAIEDV